jgi:hypothetical protein
MINGYYEEVIIEDKNLIRGLDKIITTIGYDIDKVERGLYKPETLQKYSQERVSVETFQKLRIQDRQVATEDCNVLKFNNINFDFLSKSVSIILAKRGVKQLGLSGRIWYPRNGFMGWHTNSNNQGYRLYCTYARESDKSFFRYCDPITNEIVTSWDRQGWNFRIFRIDEKLLWHCVYSETDRFSIGYSLYI